MSLLTGQEITHQGGPVTVQIILNSGTAKIECSIGDLPFSVIKEVTAASDFVKVELPIDAKWRVILTGDAVAAI